MEHLEEYMEKYPHNYNCLESFQTLLTKAMRLNDNISMSPEELIERCLSRYGGTVADALIEFVCDKTM